MPKYAVVELDIGDLSAIAVVEVLIVLGPTVLYLNVHNYTMLVVITL